MKNKKRTIQYVLVACLTTINACAMLTVMPNRHFLIPQRLASNNTIEISDQSSGSWQYFFEQ